MTPMQLAAKGTESGHQKAFFAWCAMAHLNGFEAAGDPSSYVAPGWQGLKRPVPALRWIHAIPNGGLRDPVSAALAKAEGVKRGIPDIFLPFPKGGYYGLYIEMKKPGKFKVSDEQNEFLNYSLANGYMSSICVGWIEAASSVFYYLKD